MRRLRPAVLLLAAAVAGSASAPGCHRFQVCRDGPCEPAHAGGGAGGESGATGTSAGAGTAGALGVAGATTGGNGAVGTTRAGAGGRVGHAGRPASDAGGTPDASDAGNAGASGAGDGSAGDGTPPACVAPMADCNESTFDGCETNLLTEILHCGACRARCVGACIAGECSAFENLVYDVRLPVWGGIAASATEIYALSASFADNTLLRWSAVNGAQTLYAEGEDFKQVAGGVDRLYLLGYNEELASIPRSGGVVSSEGTTARCFAVIGPTLYAVDSAGVPYFRHFEGTPTGVLPLPEPVPYDHRVWMAQNGHEVALVTEEVGVGSTSHSVYYLPENAEDQPLPWVPLTTGSDSPAQVRAGELGIYIDVILIGDERPANDFDLEHELREIAFDGTTRVVAALKGVFDFELVGRRLYVSVELPNRESRLRVVPLDDPSVAFDVQTFSTMASLTYSQGFFYFGEPEGQRLTRMPAWLE